MLATWPPSGGRFSPSAGCSADVDPNPTDAAGAVYCADHRDLWQRWRRPKVKGQPKAAQKYKPAARVCVEPNCDVELSSGYVQRCPEHREARRRETIRRNNARRRQAAQAKRQKATA